LREIHCITYYNDGINLINIDYSIFESTNKNKQKLQILK